MKSFLPVFFLFILIPFIGLAQPPQGAFGGAKGNVYGKVVDGASQKGVGFATVTVLKKSDSSMVSGALTKDNGDFEIGDVAAGSYLLRVKFVGYEEVTKPFDIEPGKLSKDLGNFQLESSTSVLETVDVTGQKAAFSMKMDKKVFDVTKSLTTVGGTAEDALKQVPSVDVDIDGNVTVRNGSPTIYVNGKSTTLELDQIPADDIDRIEVITNPSSKYSAEGMSGILNIILKTDRKPGYNGRLMAGGDTNGGYNGGANLNMYKNPFNLSLNYFNNYRNRPDKGRTERNNIFNNSILDQRTKGKRFGQFQMGRIGLDYFLDNRNTFGIEGGIGGGSFNSERTINSDFIFPSDPLTDSSSLNESLSKNSFRFYSGDFNYKHTFRKEGHELTGNIHYNKSKMTQSGTDDTKYFDADSKLRDYANHQIKSGGGDSKRMSAQIDYENPLSETIKFEAGFKYDDRESNSVYNVFDGILPDTSFNKLLSSDYDFKEEVYAGYAQFSQELGDFNYQAGIRAEQYTYEGSIPTENQKFAPSKDDLEFFPSLYLNYNLSEADQVQVNYSRRVNRPNFWQRIPYIDYSDPQNLRTGNPNLKPEHTNSFELSYNKIMGNSNLLATIYYRNTTDEINRYTEPYNGSSDTLISYSINAESNNSYGAEFTLQTQLTKWWNVTANMNLFQTELSANLPDPNDSDPKNNRFVKQKRITWFGKINSEASLPAGFTVQLTGRYSGPVPTPQGKMYRYGGMDLGVKKTIFEKKNGIITLAFSDIFNTNKFKSISEVPNFYNQVAYRQRQSRMVKLSFVYTFGKQNVQLFKRKSNKSSQDSGGGDMQDVDGGGF